MRRAVDLGYPKKDGSTLREHLESYCRQTGIWDERLDPPEIHPAVAHLWEWFWQLSTARGSGGFGPAAIGYQEIRAWMEVTGHEPTGWEVEVIRAMDDEYIGTIADKGRT